MGILLSNSYNISVASCKEPLNDELSLRFRTLGRCTHTISTKSSHGAIYKNTDSNINRATCFPSSGVGAMYIAACYLRLASCGSPLENAGLLVIVIADDARVPAILVARAAMSPLSQTREALHITLSFSRGSFETPY